MNGVLFKLSENKLTIIGTDGQRLAKIDAEMADQSLTGEYIVPLKAIEEIIKTLDQDEPAKLTFVDDKVAVEVGSTTVISKPFIW